MRTTIRLDEELLRDAKKFAAETGQTLTSVIADALQEVLARRQHKARQAPIRLRTVKGHGPLPGVDLDDSASLLDLMQDHGSAGR